jgi:arabinose-5-phosphate isomerase
LRRGLQNHEDLPRRRAEEIMTSNPKRTSPNRLAVEALKQMEEYKITSLLVVDPAADQQLVGVLHLHDLLRAGLG